MHRKLRTQPEGELRRLPRIQSVEVENHLLGRDRILLKLAALSAARGFAYLFSQSRIKASFIPQILRFMQLF